MKAHSLRQGWEATWEWFHPGAAAWPSGRDGAFQTAALCLEVLAWLSYPEPAKWKDLDIRSVTQAPVKH